MDGINANSFQPSPNYEITTVFFLHRLFSLKFGAIINNGQLYCQKLISINL